MVRMVRCPAHMHAKTPGQPPLTPPERPRPAGRDEDARSMIGRACGPWPAVPAARRCECGDRRHVGRHWKGPASRSGQSLTVQRPSQARSTHSVFGVPSSCRSGGRWHFYTAVQDHHQLSQADHAQDQPPPVRGPVEGRGIGHQIHGLFSVVTGAVGHAATRCGYKGAIAGRRVRGAWAVPGRKRR